MFNKHWKFNVSKNIGLNSSAVYISLFLSVNDEKEINIYEQQQEKNGYFINYLHGVKQNVS